MVQGLRRAYAHVGEAVHDADVDGLVDGDHGRVLKVVHPVDETEAHSEQQTQSGAELTSALRHRAVSPGRLRRLWTATVRLHGCLEGTSCTLKLQSSSNSGGLFINFL